MISQIVFSLLEIRKWISKYFLHLNLFKAEHLTKPSLSLSNEKPKTNDQMADCINLEQLIY